MIPTLNEADHIAEVVANALSLGPVLFSIPAARMARGNSAPGRRHCHRASVRELFGPEKLGAGQRSLSLEWVFILDADERITPRCETKSTRRCALRAKIVGYYVNRLPLFMGAEIRHGGMYPSWNLRLFRRGACRYENRSVHEHMICSGPTAYLSGEMLHIRRENLTRYLAKHIRYADMESDEWIKQRHGRSQAPPRWTCSPAPGCAQWLRRNVLPILPGSPIWRVLFMYVLRLGFLDGRAGWRLARLMGCYEYMIVLMYEEKVREDRNRKAGEVAGSALADATSGRPPARTASAKADPTNPE